MCAAPLREENPKSLNLALQNIEFMVFVTFWSMMLVVFSDVNGLRHREKGKFSSSVGYAVRLRKCRKSQKSSN